MRYSVWSWLLAGAALVSGSAWAAEAPLKVMSFNIRFGTANDGPNHWDLRKDVVVDMVRHYSADLIGMQECLDFQADYIAAHLPEYRWFGVGREPDGAGEHMAVLYKKDVLAPVLTGNFWLSETPETPGSTAWEASNRRMVTWAKFYHLPTRQMFWYFNTHFDHRSEPARVGAARLLSSRIGDVDADMPVVLTGDFNARAGDAEAWHILTQSGLRDVWEEAAEREGPVGTFNRFEYPSEDNTSRIDWILVRGPVRADRYEASVYNQDGRFPSDHLPVLANLTLWPSAKE